MPNTLRALLCRLLAVAALLASGSVIADPPPGDDLLGCYSSNDNMGCAHLDVPNGVVSAYLCITRCSDPDGVLGWSCRPQFEGDCFFVGYDIIGLGAWIPPVDNNLDYGFFTPLTGNGDIIHLATLNFYVHEAAVERIYLHASDHSPVPGKMVYAGGGNPALFKVLGWSSGDESRPVFGINTGPLDPPISAETSTWGGVKHLYH